MLTDTERAAIVAARDHLHATVNGNASEAEDAIRRFHAAGGHATVSALLDATPAPTWSREPAVADVELLGHQRYLGARVGPSAAFPGLLAIEHEGVTFHVGAGAVYRLTPAAPPTPKVTFVIRISPAGAEASLAEWWNRCRKLDAGTCYASALLESLTEGIAPEQHTEQADAVADLREHLGDLVTITEQPSSNDDLPF